MRSRPFQERLDTLAQLFREIDGTLDERRDTEAPAVERATTAAPSPAAHRGRPVRRPRALGVGVVGIAVSAAFLGVMVSGADEGRGNPDATVSPFVFEAEETAQPESFPDEDRAWAMNRVTGSTDVDAEPSATSGVEGYILPLKGAFWVSDRFGTVRGAGLVHEGIDLAITGAWHIEAFAACSGVVTDTPTDNSYGHHVMVECDDGRTTMYAHLSSILIEAGTAVVAGETVVGLTGSTGHSTGEHLHFEIHEDGIPVNPEDFIDFGDLPPWTPGMPSTVLSTAAMESITAIPTETGTPTAEGTETPPAGTPSTSPSPDETATDAAPTASPTEAATEVPAKPTEPLRPSATKEPTASDGTPPSSRYP